jgi:hypothetical protein
MVSTNAFHINHIKKSIARVGMAGFSVAILWRQVEAWLIDCQA